MSANIVVVSGPTASGKTVFATEISLFLKDKFGIESVIINADSTQLYKDLKIITAYPSESELSRVEHRAFGVLDPCDSSSVAKWLEIAEAEIAQAHQDGKIAIVCGGTCFYIQSLLNGIAKIPDIPEETRKDVLRKFEEIGRDAFFDDLCKLDEASAKVLHKNDTQRILRAYEVITSTGKSISTWWTDGKNKSAPEYNVLGFFILLPEKSAIHEKCRLRILKMIGDGAIEEVCDFIEKYPSYDGPLKKAIGYAEISEMLTGGSHKECIDKMYHNTKKYIKRQSTWMRNQFSHAQFLYGFGNDDGVLGLLKYEMQLI